MKLHFHGGAGCVTGVNYLLKTTRSKILIDCGLFQGEPALEQRNTERFVFDPTEVEAVIITHSHLDHIGRLPQLVRAGFKGKIFATPPTIDYTHLILDDSAKVLEEKARHAGVASFFSTSDIDRVMRLFVPVDYYKKTEISSEISFTFHEAGHVLGSAIIEAEILNKSDDRGDGQTSKKIVFSGDLGKPPAPLLRPPDFLSDTDYLVIESTYGDRNHEEPQEVQELIENIVEDTVARRGVLLIPSFALERTQQLLYHLNNLVEQKRVPVVPVFVDSPLAARATQIYEKYTRYFSEDARQEIKSGDDIFNFPGLRVTHNAAESKAINGVPPPKIIIAGSGMSQGGRILHHEARYLSDPNNTLFMVTYQAVGTLGRQLAEGARTVKILDQSVTVRAKIIKTSGYSSHADQRFLMEWARNFKKPCYDSDPKNCHTLKKVFVSQGDEAPSRTLAGLIRDELGVETMVPQLDQAAEL